MKKIFLLCSVLAALPVFAQDYYEIQDYGLRKNSTRVEFYGGMVLPKDNWKAKVGSNNVELGNTGWTAGIGLARSVIPYFGLGIDLNYTQFGDGKKVSNTYYRTGLATGLVTARIDLFPHSATRLYIPAGIGVGHTFIRKKTENAHVTTDGTDLAQMIGAGLEFDLDESLIFGVEGRYYLLDAPDEVRDTFHKRHFHHLLVMLKLGCRF
ncbi:MAG: outer membrane beta-barrel protein [Elusimicrobiaceae bacterium]|nr:outer membrane beta-barrel protein [Elusimicrobiaceae bacterium]